MSPIAEMCDELQNGCPASSHSDPQRSRDESGSNRDCFYLSAQLSSLRCIKLCSDSLVNCSLKY